MFASLSWPLTADQQGAHRAQPAAKRLRTRSALTPRQFAGFLGVALLGLAVLAPAFASTAPGSEAPIIVGQSCDLSGPTGARTQEYVKGVDAYLAYVNANGGVHGHPIKMVRYDDGFNPAKGLENSKRLAEQDNVLLYFGMGSAPVTAAMLPYAKDKGIPVFGSLSGADSLRQQHPMLFHVRASFGEEIDRLSVYLSNLGMTHVAAIAADLPIGNDGVAALEQSAKARKLEIVHIARIKNDMSNLDAEAAALAKIAPQALLVLAPAGPAVKYVESLKKNQVTSQLLGVSAMSSTALYKALGSQVEGMLLTQTVPFPWNARLGIVRDYQKRMTEANVPVSFDSMEGYVAARLLVEGLKAAGPNISRKSFIAALEAMQLKDVDGMSVNFARGSRSLMRLVDVSMISRNNKLLN
jgi:ABC-type branched-subunit amino acid transport system substrate-binding protein